MKRIMISMSAALFGASVALTGCTGESTDVEDQSSSVSTEISDAVVMSTVAEAPDWAIVHEGGTFTGYQYQGNVYCAPNDMPTPLSDSARVDVRDGDLYVSFGDETPPSGVILLGSDGWIVASFTEDASEYRIDGKVDDKLDIYAERMSLWHTCPA